MGGADIIGGGDVRMGPESLGGSWATTPQPVLGQVAQGSQQQTAVVPWWCRQRPNKPPLELELSPNMLQPAELNRLAARVSEAKRVTI
jgi:hypothetical protein